MRSTQARLFDAGPRAARAQRAARAAEPTQRTLTRRLPHSRRSPAKGRLSTQNMGWVSPTGRRISVVDWEDPWAPEPGTAWRLDGMPGGQAEEGKQPTARALKLSDTAGR